MSLRSNIVSNSPHSSYMLCQRKSWPGIRHTFSFLKPTLPYIYRKLWHQNKPHNSHLDKFHRFLPSKTLSLGTYSHHFLKKRFHQCIPRKNCHLNINSNSFHKASTSLHLKTHWYHLHYIFLDFPKTLCQNQPHIFCMWEHHHSHHTSRSMVEPPCLFDWRRSRGHAQ